MGRYARECSAVPSGGSNWNRLYNETVSPQQVLCQKTILAILKEN